METPQFGSPSDNARVTLNLDISAPIRSLARQRELVMAIYSAPLSTQETNWVEWKSEVDLGEKRWQAQLSRQVLGMANRDPDVAAKAVDGSGFIVVGVHPGELVGTVVYDTAKIEAWLTPYVGPSPDAPQWAPAYVEVEGEQILLLTVERPNFGDRPWPCRKTYSTDRRTGQDQEVAVRDGRLYVRHQASTIEATSADQDMLARRAIGGRRRIGGISLVVGPSCRGIPIDLAEDAVAAWADRERRALEPVPPEHPRKWSAPPGSSLEATAQRMAEMAEQANQVFAKSRLFIPDSRTAADYQKEVDAYISRATKVLRGVAIARAYGRKLGVITLSVHNNTDNPIHRLQVELLIDDPGIMAFAEADMPAGTLPKRPIMLGKATRSLLDSLGDIRLPNYGTSTPALHALRRVRIDNEHSARLTFDAIDLYAEEAAGLEEFFLVANPAYAGTTLTGQWSARASDISGVIRETIDVAVDPKAWTIEELLAEAAKPSADDEDEASDDV